ncbi:MAG TPA: hypothetical protein VHB98_20880 [Chloroflexota bacterium]|nr:hypothetical protein [Chloroflexota bacterium]
MACYIQHDGAEITLGNAALAATLDLAGPTPYLAAIANRLSGRRFAFQATGDCALRFSAACHRIDLAPWAFRLGSAEATDFREDEGYALRLFAPEVDTGEWLTVPLLNEFPIGAVGYTTVIYPGFAWYRQEFTLPREASGKPLTLLLGGCDDQDWLAYRVYLNGVLIGHAEPGADRWHPTPQFTLLPGEEGYAALRFGEHNTLAVQTRGLDRRTPRMVRSNLERYSVGTPLCDQVVVVGEPFRDVSTFQLVSWRCDEAADRATVVLELTDGQQTTVEAHYWVTAEEPVLHKQLLIHNHAAAAQTLLDVDVHRLSVSEHVSDGGWGEVCVVGGELFCGLRHPAGIAQGQRGEVCLRHLPGTVIGPGEQYASKVAILGVGAAGEGQRSFSRYLERHCPRGREILSIYSAYGIYDSAGSAPTEGTAQLLLENLDQLERLRSRGILFDYYAIDTGWNNPLGDLKDFDPERYPDGPDQIFARVHALGMKPGLWVSPSHGPAVFRPAVKRPDLAPSRMMPSRPHEPEAESPLDAPAYCLASEPYRTMFREALLHQVEHNGVRCFKFDGHRLQCNNPDHGHLLGTYSVEPIMDALIDTIARVRERASDVMIIWYWGVRSPWWLLYGDTLYEHGIHMEAATPADCPSVLMRQSVTVSLDQGADYVWDHVPLPSQDSLGVWISDTRWGNWMKTEGWQDAWVMDIARGSMLAQLWGDISRFDEGDVNFLARLSTWFRAEAPLLTHTRRILSDPWSGDPYGYAHGDGERAVLALHNPSFADRTVSIRLGADIGLPDGGEVQHYSMRRLHPYDPGSAARSLPAGALLTLTLAPFEVAMLQIEPGAEVPNSPFPEPARSDERSRRLACGMTELSSAMVAWEALDRLEESERWTVRRAITGRAQYLDTEELFRQSLLHSDPRDRALANRRVAGEIAVPPHAVAARLVVAAQVSRDGVFWHHRALFDIIRLRAVLDGQPLAVTTTPYRWHEQAGGWSWIAFCMALEPSDRPTRLELEARVCLPHSVALEWQAWLLQDG